MSIFKYFLEGLKFVIDTDWQRQQNTVAMNAGINPGTLSAILKGKPCKLETQEKLSQAVGREYIELVEIGKTLSRTQGKLPQNVLQ